MRKLIITITYDNEDGVSCADAAQVLQDWSEVVGEFGDSIMETKQGLKRIDYGSIKGNVTWKSID
jgi:hypothetical protein